MPIQKKVKSEEIERLGKLTDVELYNEWDVVTSKIRESVEWVKEYGRKIKLK